MLAYQNIYAAQDAQHRLRRDYRWNTGNHTRDGDTLLLFTIGPKAEEDAVNNLNFLLTIGKKNGASHLVLHDNCVQFLSYSANDQLEQDLLPQQWVEEFNEWTDSRQLDFEVQYSEQGFCYSFRTWRRSLATRKTHGVYDLATGARLTNRQEIIQRMWDHGFAAWRGRPLRVASIRWSGTRSELEDLTCIADRYWNRRLQSDMAKKMCSAYTAINRYAAWPGAW